MLKVKYAGPHVEISQHGISYKTDKEDKYVYLMVALEILKDIDNNYENQNAYSHCFAAHSFDEDALHIMLESYESDVEKHAEQEYENYQEKMKHEISFIQGLPHLKEIEKEVWIKNIELMKNYQLQRAVNKIYYKHCIENIRKLFIHKGIKELITPFNKDFFHVMNSLKGVLITGKPSLDATVKEECNADGEMCIALRIGN